MFVGVLLSTALLSLFISISYAKYTSRRPQTICRGGYCISLSNDANSINVDNKNDTLSLDGLQTQNNNSLSNHLKLQTKEKRARRMSNKKRKRVIFHCATVILALPIIAYLESLRNHQNLPSQESSKLLVNLLAMNHC
jgi:hypothetical protein